ncbi:PREDICTED: uncharacterized protein LOC108977889 [Bactrocera latifrons]|uniref:uncharacterized protein LOC108977889 n=1 Tax=Bactrocera latifrons TaxID=174628 RepID=UPI0008DE04C9|nr:PREDICTED: uncharacterized protein LOC108977889 [Bactrocera latifrons]
MYGDKALKETRQSWFVKFRLGDFPLKDKPRSGRPSAVDDDVIKALIKSDHHVTEREIGEKLNIPQSTIHDHIRRLGMGVVYFKLLKRNQAINSDVYCKQLDKLNTAIKEKRPELVNRKDRTHLWNQLRKVNIEDRHKADQRKLPTSKDFM